MRVVLVASFVAGVMVVGPPAAASSVRSPNVEESSNLGERSLVQDEALVEAAMYGAGPTPALTEVSPGVADTHGLLLAAGDAASDYVPLQPARLADSRAGAPTVDGQQAGQGLVPAGTVREIQVSGRGSVATDAIAAVLNVAVTDTSASGFLTIFPCGTPLPESSNLNFNAGTTIASSAVVKIGAGGKVCVYTYATTHLLVDVNGYFPKGSTYNTLQPARLADTRPGAPTIDGVSAGGGVVAAGDVLQVQVAGRGAVGSDVSAAAISVAVTGTQADGFITIFPCGTARPESSNLNYATGMTIANSAISKVGADGTICIYTYAAAHLIVDVNGYFAPTSQFNALQPARLADTRGGAPTIDGVSAGGGFVEANSVFKVQVVGRGGVATDATSVALNIAVTQTRAPGFLTVYPCGTDQPTASNLNYDTGTTIANASLSKLGADGTICIYTYAATHLIVDVNGYFGSTGGPVGAPEGTATASLPAGGGTTTAAGVTLDTAPNAPAVNVVVETFGAAAGIESIGAAVRKITFSNAPGPVVVSIPADGAAASVANEHLALMMFDPSINRWVRRPGTVGVINGQRVVTTTFTTTTSGVAGFASTASTLTGSGAALTASSLASQIGGPVSVMYRVGEDALSFLDRNVAAPTLRWTGLRTTAPVCTNPQPSTTASKESGYLDMLLMCTELVNGRYRVKIKNNRSVPFMMTFTNGATYEGKYAGADPIKNLTVDASKGRLLPPGSEIWISTPTNSAGNIRVSTNELVAVTVSAVDELFKQIDSHLDWKSVPMDQAVMYNVLKCAIDLDKLAQGTMTDILSIDGVSDVVGCVEGILKNSLASGGIDISKTWNVEGYGMVDSFVDKFQAFEKLLSKVRVAKDWTGRIIDMGEFSIVPDFDIKVGNIGISIHQTTLPDATVGVKYFTTLSASSSLGTSFNWSITGLPPGLTASHTLITGFPSKPGDYKITAMATDPFTQDSKVQVLTLRVNSSGWAGKLAKVENSVASYYVDLRGDWHPIPDGGTYECLAAQGKTLAGTVTAAFLNTVNIYDADPAKCVRAVNGNIVSHPDGDSYLMENGALRHIVDAPTYECQVRKGSTVVTGIPRYWVLDMPRGADLNLSCWDPVAARGKIVVDTNQRSLYIDNRGTGHRIVSGGVFDCIAQQGKPVLRNFRPSELDTVNLTEQAECIRANPGDILAHYTDLDSYVVQANFTKRWIPNGTAFNCEQGRNRNIVRAPRYYISDLTSGADLTVAESCRYLVRDSGNGQVWQVSATGTRQLVPDGWSLGCWQTNGWTYYSSVAGTKITPMTAVSGSAVCIDPAHFRSRVIKVSETNGTQTSYVVTGSGWVYWIPDTQAFSCITTKLGYGAVDGMARVTFDTALNRGTMVYKGQGRCMDAAQGSVSNIGISGISFMRADDSTPWVLHPDGTVQYITDWEEGVACVRNHLSVNGLFAYDRTGVPRTQINAAARSGDWNCWNPAYGNFRLLRNPAGNVYWAQNGRRWYVESQQVYNCLGGAAKTYYNVTDAQMNASYPEYGIGALAQCSSGKFANDRLYDCGSVNGSWVVDWWGWRKSVGSTTSYYSWKNHFTNLYGADGTRYDCTADFWAIRRASGTT